MAVTPIEIAFRAGFQFSAGDHAETSEDDAVNQHFYTLVQVPGIDDLDTFRNFVASSTSEQSPRTKAALIRLLDAWTE